jgi:hybrid cluster-associated redox disulfide protein
MKIIKFTGEEPIAYIIEKLPVAGRIFSAHGLGCIGCPMAQFESLRNGLEMHGFKEQEIKRIVEDLNLAAEELKIQDKKENEINI